MLVRSADCLLFLKLESVLGPWGSRNKGVLHVEGTERTAGWRRQNLRISPAGALCRELPHFPGIGLHALTYIQSSLSSSTSEAVILVLELREL
jgi:hypothetical protein